MGTKMIGGTDGMHKKPDAPAGKKMGGGWKNHTSAGKATSEATHKTAAGVVAKGHSATAFKGK